jgi:hypothetical protein
MSANAADGAALVAAAVVQATIREHAHRRTVAAVAAVVAGTVLSAAARPGSQATMPKVRTQESWMHHAWQMMPTTQPSCRHHMRVMRHAQRLRKKQRRREAKQAALNSQCPAHSDDQPCNDVSPATGAGGQRAKHVGASADVLAPAP